MGYLLEELRGLVVDAADGLDNVEERRLFGCAAWFAADTMFALVWKEGRIGLKLPGEADYRELMGVAGSAPWRAGNKLMGGWVLVPEDFHDDAEALRAWARRAHAQALAAGPKGGPGRRPRKRSLAAVVKTPAKPKKGATSPSRNGSAPHPHGRTRTRGSSRRRPS